MPSQIDFFVAFLLGVGPALGILWFSLRRFDRPRVDHTLFDDRRVFGALAAGMIFGVIASVLTLLVQQPTLAASLLVLGFLLLFEEGFKLVYLNRRKYRGRFDTTFYGLSLGLGAASTVVAASAFWSAGNLFADPGALAFLALFSLTLGLANAASGSLIGFGASRGETWRPLAQALGVRAAHSAFLYPFLILAGTEEAFVSVLALLTSLGFAVIVYGYAYEYLLPETLPEDIRRKIRRERRRARAVRE